MDGRDILRCARFLLLIAMLPLQLWSTGGGAAEPIGKAEDIGVTPSLVREMQFMLLRLGMEPGPIDGVIGPQTTKAWAKFQQDTGLPQTDLVNGGKIPATALTRLRSEASRVIFESERKSERSAAAPPATALAPIQPAVQAPDRFAACPFSAEDFRIGNTQYTPEKYLQEGFEGSTTRAVAMLKDRLNEARQIAGNIGGSALAEVQRQSRVLDDFNCRLKIEQESQK